MPRTGITKKQVFTAAKKVLATGKLPTAMNVRNVLTNGSITTIQKYLHEWKHRCFTEANLHSALNTGTQNDELIEENLKIKQIFNKQTAQNEYYANELINTEKTIIKLKEDNHQLQTSKQQLQSELKEAVAINATLEKLHQELQSKLDHNNNQTIVQQQHIINNLQTELKTLGETSLSALRDTSIQGHEALLQEKLISINLQAKIDGLAKELAEKNKQLELVELKTQVQVRSLQRQIKVQQQALQRFVTSDELNQLIQGLESNLLLSGSYGK